MKLAKYFLSFIILLHISCTSNPFWDNNDIKEKSITGKIILSDNSDSKDGIFVWLEGFDLSTYTDENGNFKIIIPPPESQGNSNGLSGDFKLYFWLSNYEIKYATIPFSNGKFSAIQNYINRDGEFQNDVNLQKILSISITTTNANNNGIGTDVFKNGDILNLNVQLNSTCNSNKSINTYKYFLPRNTGEIPTGVIFESLSNPDKNKQIRIISAGLNNESFYPYSQIEYNYEFEFVDDSIRQVSTTYSRTFKSHYISSGKYKIYTYILFPHDELPEELTNNLDENLFHIDAGYYKIPMKRDDVIIEIDF
ncbi:MAG: hypothetical protein U9N76_02120 [Candidatus Marinimicrobia bacterium]|nr:hypothetical protein [Candidatus Neomarinimicrobiota bacterium]